MSNYAVISGSRILRTFSADSPRVAALLDSEAVRVGIDVRSDTHFMQRDVAVLIPPQPSNLCRFDFDEGKWVACPLVALQEARKLRDSLLSSCDWRVMPDAPTPAESKASWLEYRQALRDITEQSDMLAIVWPVPPV